MGAEFQYGADFSRSPSPRCRSRSRRRVQPTSARRWFSAAEVKYLTWTADNLLRQVVYECQFTHDCYGGGAPLLLVTGDSAINETLRKPAAITRPSTSVVWP